MKLSLKVRRKFREYNRKWRLKWASTPEGKEARRMWTRKARYGPKAVSHYKERLRKQKGHCAICGLKMKPPNQDHNHKTGKLRSLLCGPCNRGLGYFKDSARLLQKAAVYLRRWK